VAVLQQYMNGISSTPSKKGKKAYFAGINGWVLVYLVMVNAVRAFLLQNAFSVYAVSRPQAPVVSFAYDIPFWYRTSWFF